VSIKISDRNGPVVGAVQVEDLDEIMLITDNGTLVRTRVNEVGVISRNTQGVRIIRTTEDEHVVALQRIDEIEDDDTSFDEQLAENELLTNTDSSITDDEKSASDDNSNQVDDAPSDQ
jgi:DNA gyrase subunit A